MARMEMDYNLNKLANFSSSSRKGRKKLIMVCCPFHKSRDIFYYWCSKNNFVSEPKYFYKWAKVLGVLRTILWVSQGTLLNI